MINFNKPVQFKDMRATQAKVETTPAGKTLVLEGTNQNNEKVTAEIKPADIAAMAKAVGVSTDSANELAEALKNTSDPKTMGVSVNP